jgi:hypothetical protein
VKLEKLPGYHFTLIWAKMQPKTSYDIRDGLAPSLNCYDASSSPKIVVTMLSDAVSFVRRVTVAPNNPKAANLNLVSSQILMRKARLFLSLRP